MKTSVLVIGGGLTGLTAARDLQRAGFAVTVVERAPTLGGLAEVTTIRGHPLEKAYHHLFRTDTDILALVQELGLGDELEWRESSMAIRYGGRFHPFSGPRDLLRFQPLPWIDRLRVGLVVAFLQKFRRGTRLAGERAGSWMRRWSGAAASRVIWEPLLRGKFAGQADTISMAWLWARIHIRANSRAEGGPEKLGYFRQGFGRIAEKLAADFVERGGCLRVSTEIESLRWSGDAWRARCNGEELSFRAVLFTGSCPSFLRFLQAQALVLDEDYVRRLQRITYLSATCVIFSYPRPLTEAYWNNMNEPDAPFLVLIHHTRLVEPSRYGGRCVYYLGAYHDQGGRIAQQPDQELVNEWLTYVGRLCPGFDRAQVEDLQVHRFRDAQHCVDVAYAENLPAHATPQPGLFLANFAQIYPEDRGTNYAVRDGRRVAQSIAHSLRSPC